jgi:hypothetical protein
VSGAAITLIDPVRFEIERSEVRRLLGYGPRARPPAPRIEAAIDACLREAEELIDAGGCFTFKALDGVPDSGPFKGAERIALGVCTIGRGLPERVRALAKRGEPLRALVLDAIGSAAVEAATDAVNAVICEEVAQTSRFTNRRISPGYRSWSIEAQREIFALLPSSIHGVELTPALVMDPLKSVSFGVSVGRGVRHSKYVSICAYCNLRSCRYRRAPGSDGSRGHRDARA